MSYQVHRQHNTHFTPRRKASTHLRVDHTQVRVRARGHVARQRCAPKRRAATDVRQHERICVALRRKARLHRGAVVADKEVPLHLGLRDAAVANLYMARCGRSG